MKDQTHATRRGSIYYYRRRIPAHLTSHYGRSEEIFSLKTRDPKEAARLARIEDVKFDQQWQHLSALQGVSPREELSREEIGRLAALYYAHLLEEDEEARMDDALSGGVSDRKWDNKAFSLDFVGANLAFDAGRSRLGDTFEEEDFVSSHGIRLTADSPSFVPLMVAMKAEFSKAIDAMKVRHGGAVVDTPVVEPGIIRGQAHGGGLTFGDLTAYWQTQKSPRPRTLMEVESIVGWVHALYPGLLASRMTKAHVISFKDDQLSQGKAPLTVRKYLGLIRGLFSIAVENQKLASNPTTGVRVALPKVAKKARLPFAPTQLNALFSSPVFTQGTRPLGGRGEAAFWLPLIALWTGARQSEIGQLMTTDISEEQGAYVFYFTTDAEEDQTQKSEASRRWVPLHSELVKCGLLEYWREMKKRGDGQLFPAMERTRQGNIAAAWSQWFGRYLRGQVGITDKRKVFHSFRHGFKDACRDAGISREVHDALTGHGATTPNSGDGYGDTFFPLPALVAAVSRIRYDGLDLSHIYRETVKN